MEICITNLLRDKGFKVTPQRLAIYKMLAGTKTHPNAEMIFNKLQPQYPTMSFATVYKTMDILAQIGLVQILNAGEDSFRYDANTSSHPHIRCIECRRVDDLEGVNDEKLLTQVIKNTSYRITGRQLYFYGVCPECQKKTTN